jgi:hypothetical protein
MSEAKKNQPDSIQDPNYRNSVMFAQLIFQLSNTAMVLMGKVADPEAGKTVEDLDAAQLFIDQIEMLEAKTKGNLSNEEISLLKQTLMTLRMAFVEAVEAVDKKRQKAPTPEAAPAQPAQAQPSQAPAAAPAEEEHPKKFSKKY